MALQEHYINLPTPITLGNSGGWKTLITFTTAAADRYDIKSWGLYPKGTVNSDPGIEGRLIRGSNTGTGGASATPSKRNAFPEAVSGTAKVATAGAPFTVEPTVTGEAIDYKPAHPQGGGDWPSLQRGGLVLGGGEILLLQYRNDSGGASIPAGADLCLER